MATMPGPTSTCPCDDASRPPRVHESRGWSEVEEGQLRRLDQLPELAEEGSHLGAVGDAVIEGARQRHRGTGDHRIVDDDRPRLERSHAEDGGLGMVDDGNALVEAERPEV